LIRRKNILASYLKALVARSDILNSKELGLFLEIDKHAPDVLIRQPKLIESLNLTTSPSEQFAVTHSHFITSHRVFVLCLNDVHKKTSSKLEIYSISHKGILNDSFMDLDEP
jgi:hypothetical protein